jgi:hypothetical protein
MTTPTLSRVIILALITCPFLFLSPDRIHDPLLNRNVNYSYSPFTQDKQNIDEAVRARIEQVYGKLASYRCALRSTKGRPTRGSNSWRAATVIPSSYSQSALKGRMKRRASVNSSSIWSTRLYCL